VDVWAAGILAYELLVGKPPFEVKDESQTVNRILTCTNITLPPRHSALWADFVKQGLEKRPNFRPDAATLLDHPCARRRLLLIINPNPDPTLHPNPDLTLIPIFTQNLTPPQPHPTPDPGLIQPPTLTHTIVPARWVGDVVRLSLWWSIDLHWTTHVRRRLLVTKCLVRLARRRELSEAAGMRPCQG